jgi:hypothetical protein
MARKHPGDDRSNDEILGRYESGVLKLLLPFCNCLAGFGWRACMGPTLSRDPINV